MNVGGGRGWRLLESFESFYCFFCAIRDIGISDDPWCYFHLSSYIYFSFVLGVGGAVFCDCLTEIPGSYTADTKNLPLSSPYHEVEGCG